MVMLCICQLMPNELFTIELKNLSIARRCGRNNTVSAGSADEQQLRLCVSEGQLRFLKLPRMISRAGNRCQTGGWCDCTYPREELWMRQGDEQRLTPMEKPVIAVCSRPVAAVKFCWIKGIKSAVKSLTKLS